MISISGKKWEEKEINPNKINDKTKFIDLYNFYNK